MKQTKLLIFLIIFILSSSLVLSYRQAITPSFFFSQGNITLNLTNYYLKSEVYNQTEIDNLPVSHFNNDIGYLTNITSESILSLSDVNNQTLNNGSLMSWNIEQQYFEFIYNINDYYTNETDILSTQIKMNQDFELYDWFNTVQSAGRISGGLITPLGNGSVSIEHGTGLIKSMSSSPGDGEECELNNCASISKTLYVEWDTVTSLALIDNAYNYIYYHGDTGEIRTTTNFYSIDYTRDFTLGRAYKDNGNIIVRLCGTNLWNFNRRVQLFGEEVYPIKRANGLILSETGTRNIKVTGGILWAELLNRFTTETVDTSLTSNFTYWYLNSTGGWVRQDGMTQIDNQQYNLIGTGLQTLTPNRYGVHWVYVVHDSSVHVVYGRGNYQLTEALNSKSLQEIPGLLDAYATLVGRIIIQRGGTSFIETASAFEQVFTTSQATIHNELAGIQGGATNEYYHLNLGNYTYLTSNAFLTSYTETDPVFTGHVSSNITTNNITNWNTAYGWGDHALAGYITNVVSGGLNVSGDTNTNDIILDDGNAFYFNDKNVDGSWRVRQNGSDLVFEKRVSGSWVEKIVYD